MVIFYLARSKSYLSHLRYDARNKMNQLMGFRVDYSQFRLYSIYVVLFHALFMDLSPDITTTEALI